MCDYRVMKKSTFLIIIIIVLAIIGFYLLFWCSRCNNNLTKVELGDITNLNIAANQAISSPLTITGKAKGPWFFEASFPIVLVDWDGLIIAESIAQAEGDWMTEGLVPFTATLKFTKPAYGERGAIILKRDNPSGLPAGDAAVEIPVTFK